MTQTPHSQALVTRIDQDGTAEVIIQTGQACCIPGPPELSDHHNPGPGTITVKVNNPAGASVGDLVSLAHPPGAVKRSTRILLGIPGAGLIFGAILGAILALASVVQISTILIFSGAGLLLGTAVGIGRYMRVREASLLVTKQIIKTGTNSIPCETSSTPNCHSCLGGNTG
ncbi:MAG: SoxR reducing system RseC family protein [Gammaproteobacteria bacterium]|nr:SoxR reducing system RseC family protein [Gammaproteobacteria bacterium]